MGRGGGPSPEAREVRGRECKGILTIPFSDTSHLQGHCEARWVQGPPLPGRRTRRSTHNWFRGLPVNNRFHLGDTMPCF